MNNYNLLLEYYNEDCKIVCMRINNVVGFYYHDECIFIEYKVAPFKSEFLEVHCSILHSYQYEFV